MEHIDPTVLLEVTALTPRVRDVGGWGGPLSDCEPRPKGRMADRILRKYLSTEVEEKGNQIGPKPADQGRSPGNQLSQKKERKTVPMLTKI